MAEKKVFHFRAAGGFADTKMYQLASQARKHAQKLARDLGRVVRYYMTGGVHHSVKPPKANPCKRKKAASKGKNPAGWKRGADGAYRAVRAGKRYKLRKGSDGWYLNIYSIARGVFLPAKGPFATLTQGKKAAGAKPKKAGKKNPAGLSDWVGVKGAEAVRVRRVKGATLLDIKG